MVIVFTFIFLSAIGSFFRLLVSQYGPLGVLAVNITGSFFLALTYNWVGAGVTAIGIGALGSFTTFSAFTADAVPVRTSAHEQRRNVGRRRRHAPEMADR